MLQYARLQAGVGREGDGLEEKDVNGDGSAIAGRRKEMLKGRGAGRLLKMATWFEHSIEGGSVCQLLNDASDLDSPPHVSDIYSLII